MPVVEKVVLPPGYTYAFLRQKSFASTKAEKIAAEMLEEAETLRNRGKLALIEKSLATLHSKIVKKDWNGAFVVLEALSLFNELDGDWPMCDDGKHIVLTNKVYGASLVTVLRALKKDARLDASHFPSLETLLRSAADWGDAMKSICCPSDYDLVCKAIGARLFPESAADVDAKKARLDAWLASCTEQERVIFHRKVRDAAEDEDEEEEEEGPWHAGGSELDEDVKDNDFVLPRVWKEYKDYLAPRGQR
ncbi:hypothetical protein C8F04DRAFT_1026939 [Mycena alexandri]|uniref:Uncharacterized protein n=1 Tax=Mycena alexandri TaxID=1745969 RepID=A0AAD6TG85_9AGAR|nr:hypothetical protein C8F04DRAFT_1026939 [Mycena alexandri]